MRQIIQRSERKMKVADRKKDDRQKQANYFEINRISTVLN